MYTQFKEYTEQKKRLFYVTKNITDVLAKVHEIIYILLPVYGHVSHISKKKIGIFTKDYIDFKWLTCNLHSESIQKDVCFVFLVF